jgi:phosphoribosylamine--glycine ligase
MVVDGGARGQSIGIKVAEENAEVFISPGNPGNEDFAHSTGIEPTDIAGQLQFARQNKIDLTVVGADDPLGLGIVDAFQAEKLAIYGPTQAQARIESNRNFGKETATQNNIPIGPYVSFTSRSLAEAYAETRSWPLFVKDNELAQGKGAEKCEDMSEFRKKIKKVAGLIVVEDFVFGPEASHHAFCDGKNYLSMPFLVRDHKTIGDNDTGDMTGGMGVVGPLPNYSLQEVEALGATFVEPVIRRLGFKGVLFSGLKGEKGQEKLLEWNARPGDPEMQVFIELLESDLLPILWACVEGSLDKVRPPEWRVGQSIVNLVLASEGYPGEYNTGAVIEGIEMAERVNNVKILHAATKREQGKLLTNGGRVLNIIAGGESLQTALKRAYTAAEQIGFGDRPPIFRRDIGRTVLLGL